MTNDPRVFPLPGLWRPVKKKDLEILLEKVERHPSPSPRLEQYQTPAAVAADVLFWAAQLGDIQGRKVVDLGCGTGILAIGASLIGAREAVAIDVDEAALGVAIRNASALGAEVSFLTVDVSEFPESCDTVLMNPPFGAQNAHADRPFLEAACRIGRVVYSFHNAPTEAFVLGWFEDRGAAVTHRRGVSIPIPRPFDFHPDEGRPFPVLCLPTQGAPPAAPR